MEDQTPVLVFARVGTRQTIGTWLDRLQQLGEKETLVSICEEGVEGAVLEGEAAVAAVEVRADTKEKVQDVIVNPSSVGEDA